MSGKLDQSLDQIMHDTKPTGGRANRNRKPRAAKSKAKVAIAAPKNGVQKARTDRQTAPSAVSAFTSRSGESKVIVSNLPEDVNENQIKDYFTQTIGQVKNVSLTYGPTGRSRGIATIIFRNGEAGARTVKQLDGVKVDNKPMKIELIVNAKAVPAPPAPKGLADRMSQQKNTTKDKPKPARAATANDAAKTKGPGGKKGRTSRPKKKTAEELDAEMADYFGPGEGAVNGGNTQAPTNGADAMVDEVL